MLTDLSMLRLSSTMADHASQRHALISENIAQADTPGFRARDLPVFSDVFDAQTMTVTSDMRVEVRNDNLSPNGNSVSLEDEMMRAAQVQNDHALAMSMYKSTLTMLRTVIGKSL